MVVVRIYENKHQTSTTVINILFKLETVVVLMCNIYYFQCYFSQNTFFVIYLLRCYNLDIIKI
jgi:hypothetical protein